MRHLLFGSLVGMGMMMGACGHSKNKKDTKAVQGGVSGGGGYLDSDADTLLRQQGHVLANTLRDLPSPVFSSLPTGWTLEKFTAVLENVRSQPAVERQRDGRELMFDFGEDASGPYIVALRPYFLAFGSASELTSEPSVLLTLRRRLLHEALHLLGLKEADAAKRAQEMMEAINSGAVNCSGNIAEKTTCPVGSGENVACTINTSAELSFKPGVKKGRVSNSQVVEYSEEPAGPTAGGGKSYGREWDLTEFTKADPDTYSFKADVSKVVASLTTGELHMGELVVPLTCKLDFPEFTFH